jgi:hypothetical protein
MFITVVKMALDRRAKGLPPLVPRRDLRSGAPLLAPVKHTKESTPLAMKNQEDIQSSARPIVCLTPFLAPLNRSPTTRAGEPLDSITLREKPLMPQK